MTRMLSQRAGRAPLITTLNGEGRESRLLIFNQLKTEELLLTSGGLYTTQGKGLSGMSHTTDGHHESCNEAMLLKAAHFKDKVVGNPHHSQWR